MNSMSQRTRSVWMTERPEAAPLLSESTTADVAIVGAGIGGLTTAYLLARDGLKVVVVDSGPPGGGMTARTTAHITCALDDRWYDLISIRGERDARIAAEAHRGAIDLIENIVDAACIDCDFARVDGFLVPAAEKDAEELRKELKAAQSVGLSEVSLGQAPFGSYDSALRFPRQARFHPLKYLRGLIRAIEQAGGKIFTGHATSVEGGKDAVVKLKDGPEIRAQVAIVATNVPINDRVVVHNKMAPYRTYVIAAHVPKGSVPDALMWDTGWPYHYVRIQPDGDRDVIIVGGEDHKTGQADDMLRRLHDLEAWARERFPMMERIGWRWSGQVMESIDYLGYLGRNPGKDKNVYIITADSGMGMTHATIGAKIICDEIADRENAWAELFDPSRKTLRAGLTYAKENLNVAGQMLDHVTPGEVPSVDEIPVGSGAIVRQGAHQIAAYRDDDNNVIAHSAVCPHLGCVVSWNAFEKCWDCPCHGSQFSADGKVINGPAIGDLAAAGELRETKQQGAGQSQDSPRP